MNRKEVLLISIGVFLTVVAWLIADVYHVGAREYGRGNLNLPLVNQTAINKEMIELLKNKKY